MSEDRQEEFYETLRRGLDHAKTFVQNAESGKALTEEELDQRFGVDYRPWLVPDLVGVDIQKNGITIMKTPSCGKTETVISKAVQCGMTSTMNPLLQCETKEDIQDYMDNLKSRYGK